MSLTKWFKSRFDKFLAARGRRRPRRHLSPLGNVLSGAFRLEERRLLSNGTWAPLFGNDWDGEGTFMGQAHATNWVGFGGRIFDKNGSGYPGEYGTDTATFDGNSSNQSCVVTGVNNSLEALSIGAHNYTGTVSLGQVVTVHGGGGPGHFTLTSGTLALDSSNYLTIQDCNAESNWSGEPLTAAAGVPSTSWLRPRTAGRPRSPLPSPRAN